MVVYVNGIAITLLALSLLTGLWFTYRGSVSAQVFLWAWAILLMVCVPLLEYGYSLFFYQALPVVGVAIVAITVGALRHWEEGDVGAAQEETRRVLAEMNSRIDAERKYMAGRLHDDINHKLLEAKMYLRRLRPLIEKNIVDPTASSQAQTILMNTLDLIFETYVECRDIIKNTRVEIIESIGIISAISDMVNQYKAVLQRPRIAFEHNLPAGIEPTGDVAINIYRIVQEAILNTVKHAKAQNAKVRFLYSNRDMSYRLEIEDDGEGMNPANKTGIGMIDIRERANAIGAELNIHTRPKEGTRLVLKFKRKPEPDKHQPAHPGDAIPSEAHF